MAGYALSLAKALKDGRLEDFILQQENAGVGPISEVEFLLSASKVIKHETQSDRTSHSASSDGSTEK